MTKRAQKDAKKPKSKPKPTLKKEKVRDLTPEEDVKGGAHTGNPCWPYASSL